MNNYRFVPVLLIFLSPLLYILSGCDRLDAPAPQASAEPQWVITNVGNPSPSQPVAVKSPLCRCEDCTCDPCECGTKPAPPTMAPVPDGQPNKYAPLKFPEPDRTPPKPLTAEQKAGLSNGEACTDGSCSVQGGGGGGGFRLFPRLRGRR